MTFRNNDDTTDAVRIKQVEAALNDGCATGYCSIFKDLFDECNVVENVGVTPEKFSQHVATKVACGGPTEIVQSSSSFIASEV